MDKVRPIAIHLPQFHPFPENDKWWGKGFTEWTNVTKAKPLFKGHYQPHLPSDLGFYDLRLEEARTAQAALAKEYGIYGFCYYHYWFNGKRLLNRPLDDMLKTMTPDFPFMLCWANENWTRTWDGLEKHVLMEQKYSQEDDIAHIRFVIDNFFTDPRYIRVEGKPMYAVYRPSHFPDIKKTTEIWREEAHKSGIGDLYLVYVQSFSLNQAPKELGFDAAIEFQPKFLETPSRIFGSREDRLKHKIGMHTSPFVTNNIFDYSQYVDLALRTLKIQDDVFPGITPGWDNSARRKENAYIFHNSTPEEYERWLKGILEAYSKHTGSHDKFVFINAWNEWAEGNHLEPCHKWGRSYLEATKRAFEQI